MNNKIFNEERLFENMTYIDNIEKVHRPYETNTKMTIHL